MWPLFAHNLFVDLYVAISLPLTSSLFYSVNQHVAMYGVGQIFVNGHYMKNMHKFNDLLICSIWQYYTVYMVNFEGVLFSWIL